MNNFHSPLYKMCMFLCGVLFVTAVFEHLWSVAFFSAFLFVATYGLLKFFNDFVDR